MGIRESRSIYRNGSQKFPRKVDVSSSRSEISAAIELRLNILRTLCRVLVICLPAHLFHPRWNFREFLACILRISVFRRRRHCRIGSGWHKFSAGCRCVSVKQTWRATCPSTRPLKLLKYSLISAREVDSSYRASREDCVRIKLIASRSEFPSSRWEKERQRERMFYKIWKMVTNYDRLSNVKINIYINLNVEYLYVARNDKIIYTCAKKYIK